MSENVIKTGFITKVSAKYCDKFPLRATIQAIPILGSTLDTMLAGLGVKYQYDRLENFISDLQDKLKVLKKVGINKAVIEPSEELFDFMMKIFDEVIKTRSKEKRKRFANLVASQVINQRHWDEAENACRLLGDLTVNHIRVLLLSTKAEKTDFPSEGNRPVRISHKDRSEDIFSQNSLYLTDYIHDLPEMAIRMICSELMAKGLMKDVGFGFGHLEMMKTFSPTDLADWLVTWISEPKLNSQ
jgi:hypothetical protein